MRFRLLPVTIVALAAVLAACGGDDDGAATTDPGDAATTAAPGDTGTTTSAASEGNGDDIADSGETVRVDYVGTLGDGSEFDSSAERGPLEFVLAAGQMIPGFDAAVQGMTVGEVKTVTIPAADAYGEHSEDNVIEFPIDEVPEEFRVEGIQVDLGNGLPATVVEVTDAVVRVDTNHPLAGEDLTFAITLVEILP